MDELDHNLLTAWHRVFERCRNDPAEARRRYERMHAGGTYDRPVRAWCVAIRASDTRLNGIEGAIKAADGIGGLGDQGDSECDDSDVDRLEDWLSAGDGNGGCHRRPPMPSAALDETDPIRAQAAHKIVLDGWALKQLGGAVSIPYPGVPLREAAAKLGRDPASIKKWLPVQVGKTVAEKQAFVQERYRSGSGRGERRWAEYYAHETGRGVFNVRYVPAGAAGRGAGMEVPVVWCDHDLDPGGFMGRPPSRWWGTLWKYLADEVPDHFEQGLEREPVVQPYEGGERFRGWQWRCPGLIGDHKAVDGIRGLKGLGDGFGGGVEERPPMASAALGCGRLVRALYAPLPVRTIGEYLGIEEGLKVEGLSGQWLPGVMDRWAGRRSLACERCWKIKRQTFTNSTGWNELVTYLSGGLLFGREVEKPAGFEYERKQPYRKRRGARREMAGRPTVDLKNLSTLCKERHHNL